MVIVKRDGWDEETFVDYLKNDCFGLNVCAPQIHILKP